MVADTLREILRPLRRVQDDTNKKNYKVTMQPRFLRTT